MQIRRARPYLWTLGLLWLLPSVAALVGFLVLDKDAHGQCEGIGFGCTLSDADLLVLLVALAAPYLFGAGLLVCAVIAIVRRRRAASDRHRVFASS